MQIQDYSQLTHAPETKNQQLPWEAIAATLLFLVPALLLFIFS